MPRVLRTNIFGDLPMPEERVEDFEDEEARLLAELGPEGEPFREENLVTILGFLRRICHTNAEAEKVFELYVEEGITPQLVETVKQAVRTHVLYRFVEQDPILSYDNAPLTYPE